MINQKNISTLVGMVIIIIAIIIIFGGVFVWQYFAEKSFLFKEVTETRIEANQVSLSEYFKGAEAGYDTEVSKQFLISALNDILNLSIDQLKNKKYQDPAVNPTSKVSFVDIQMVINRYFIPDGHKILANNFYQEVKSTEGQEVIKNIIKEISNGTFNWKTYTNKEYEFEVKYDPILDSFKQEGNGEVGQFTYLQVVSFKNELNSTNFINNPHGYEIEVSRKSIDNYKTEIVGHIADKIDSEQEVLINGNSWTKINYKIFLTTDYISVTTAIVNHNGYGYAIIATTDDIDKIIYTFKFTK